jgi:hypothetical protein
MQPTAATTVMPMPLEPSYSNVLTLNNAGHGTRYAKVYLPTAGFYESLEYDHSATLATAPTNANSTQDTAFNALLDKIYEKSSYLEREVVQLISAHLHDLF